MEGPNLDVYQQTKDKIKSYWNRPGGKFGSIVFYALLAVVGYKFYTAIFPKLMELFDDTTELAFGLTKAVCAMAVCAFFVGGFIYALASPRFRVGITAVWEKLFINSWLQWFIKVDPVKIAHGKIDEFEEEREKFAKKSAEIGGELVNSKKELLEIDRNILNIEKKIAVSKTLEEAGMLTREKGYAIEWKNKLLPLKNGLEVVQQKLDLMYENSGYALQDMKNQFEYTTKMYRTTSTAASALGSALSMFSGKGAKSQLGDEAMFFMESQISANLGTMRQDMKSIDKFVGSIDLQNRVYEADGLEEIKRLNPDLYKKFQVQAQAQGILPTTPVGQVTVLQTTTKPSDKNDFLSF